MLSSILPRLALDETEIASDVIREHFMGDNAVIHRAQTSVGRNRHCIRCDCGTFHVPVIHPAQNERWTRKVLQVIRLKDS